MRPRLLIALPQPPARRPAPSPTLVALPPRRHRQRAGHGQRRRSARSRGRRARSCARAAAATDAAIATLLALNVVEPQSSGIGGGGSVYSDRAAARRHLRRARDRAGGRDRHWFFKDGQPLAFSRRQPGGRASACPGNVRHDGARPPAPRQAALGGAVPAGDQARPRRLRDHAAGSTTRSTITARPARFSAEARGAFLRCRTAAPSRPARWSQTRRSRPTSSSSPRAAPDSFYAGPNAAGDRRGRQRQRRTIRRRMTAGDHRRPTTPSRGRRSAAPTAAIASAAWARPRRAGSTVLRSLKQLERFDLSALGPHSPTAWHLIAESERLAYADRDKYLGDPDFVRVPLAGLTDPAYLASRSALISPTSTIASRRRARRRARETACAPRSQPERGTVAFRRRRPLGQCRVRDLDHRKLVRVGPHGQRLLSQQRADRLQLRAREGRLPGRQPRRRRQAAAQLDEPDARLWPGRQAWSSAVGAAGGSTIPAQVAKAIIGVIDFHLSPQDAIALPVIFAPGDTVYRRERAPSSQRWRRSCSSSGITIDYRAARHLQGQCDRVAERPLGRRRRSAQRRRGGLRNSHGRAPARTLRQSRRAVPDAAPPRRASAVPVGQARRRVAADQLGGGGAAGRARSPQACSRSGCSPATASRWSARTGPSG